MNVATVVSGRRGAGQAPQRTLGRFGIRRELGSGAQATVWLAHDPRLDREVALKLLNAGAGEEALAEWLHEARVVGRLAHPNVVPVFEADSHEGQPYLVFEYVEGPTLAQARRGKGPMPPREAVELMLGVLDALGAAHAAGLVHRDLKPSNVLIGRDGRPRVMDFGIAARISETDGRIVGTPGYISPEAARGEPAAPTMDVFAAGVMLGELLAGAPLLRESDPYRAIARIQREDLELPAALRIDAGLRAIVQRALARDAALRYDGAASLRDALAAWLPPAPKAEDAPLAEAGSHETLAFLLRRMRTKTDFPALSSSIVRIQRVATSERENLQTLADAILADVALTNKLLRMVNTAYFTAVAGGGIASVSRAVALVGFAGIRNMALSVVLLEHMENKAQASALKEEFLRSLMAGTLADELAHPGREGEEAYLGALFQNLGRLLVECYLPDEAAQIRTRLARSESAPTIEEREAAARQVLGLGFDDLGAGVAHAWSLPETMQRAMRAPAGEVPRRPPERGPEQALQRLRWLGRSANTMADAMLVGDEESLLQVAETFSAVLGESPRDMLQAGQRARGRLRQLADAMGLRVAPDAPARRLLGEPVGARASAAATPGPTTPGSAPGTTPANAAGAPTAASASLPALSALKAQLSARLSAPGRGGASGAVAEALPLLLEGLRGALQFRRVVLCLREPGGSQLRGRLAVGDGGPGIAARFLVPTEAGPRADLFSGICTLGRDLLVSDAQTVAPRLPAWYRGPLQAGSFVLLPLVHDSKPFGLIYADRADAGSIHLAEADLAVLREMREELVSHLARR